MITDKNEALKKIQEYDCGTRPILVVKELIDDFSEELKSDKDIIKEAATKSWLKCVGTPLADYPKDILKQVTKENTDARECFFLFPSEVHLDMIERDSTALKVFLEIKELNSLHWSRWKDHQKQFLQRAILLNAAAIIYVPKMLITHDDEFSHKAIARQHL